jgi:hypothetical protein
MASKLPTQCLSALRLEPSWKINNYEINVMMPTSSQTMTSSWKKRFFLAGFFFINLLLSTYFIDAWITPNATSRALPVITLYEDSSLVIDNYQSHTIDKAFVNGHYYSDKAPLSTFLVYPFYAAYKSISNTPDNEDNINRHPIYIWDVKGIKDGRIFLFPKLNVPLVLGSFICGSLPFATLVTCILIYIYKRQEAFPPVVMAMLSTYGTFLFALSGVYLSHLLSGLFLLLAYICIKEDRNYFLAGFLIGLAFLSEYTTAIAGPIWFMLILYKTRKYRKAIAFALGAVPAILFVLYYNQITTGHMFDFLYSHVAMANFAEMNSNFGFHLPRIEAMWGLLFSSYRGLFFYAPIFILIGYCYLKKSFQFEWKSVTDNYLFIFVLAYFLVNSSYYMWWGGWSFGPRHLVPVAMLLLFEGAIFLTTIRFSRLAFFILATAGILLAWGDKATRIYLMPDNPYRFSDPLFDLILPDFSQHKFNANNLPTILFDLSPQTSVYLWLLLFVLSVILLNKWYRSLNPGLI